MQSEFCKETTRWLETLQSQMVSSSFPNHSIPTPSKMRTSFLIVVFLSLGCSKNDAPEKLPMITPQMTARVLNDKAYWAQRKPYDISLPESVPEMEVEADLAVMQERFRSAMSEIGLEDTDWELPGHYQHVRVFYAYLHTRKLYTPKLCGIIRDTMRGFEKNWIGEFECYNVPGREDRGITLSLYLDGQFVFTNDDDVDDLITALGLRREVVK